jgi:hypothetical protein
VVLVVPGLEAKQGGTNRASQKLAAPHRHLVSPVTPWIKRRVLGRSGTGAPAMSIIPRHLQRRFDERWAARFGSLIVPAVKECRIERFAGQHAPRSEKAKETRRVEAEGEAEMSENEESTDPELSAAERKELRGREAKEAVADHEAAQQAFHENRERLREERLAREAAAGPMLYPVPDTPIETVRFSTRIRNAVTAGGMANRRRNSRGFGCNAVGPPGSWAGLGQLSS